MEPIAATKEGQRIRVCHLVSGDLWAGAEVMGFQLLKSLKDFNDLDLSVIVLNRGRFAAEIENIGIPVDVVDEKQFGFTQLLERVKALIKKKRPDVIHCHLYKLNILAFLAARGKNAASLVSTQHGMPEFIGRKWNLKYFALNRINFFLLSRWFHATVAVSNNVRKALVEQYGFNEKRTFLIYNGAQESDAQSKERTGKNFTIGAAGRYFPVKDFPFMVEIARNALEMESAIRFEIAGDGPEKNRVAEMIRRYGIEESFLLRGFLDDVVPFYTGIDVFMNTSVHEGLPMSILEAMAHGLPIIAPEVGGLGEIIEDGVQGFLIKGRDPKVFANRCVQLYKDKQLRRQMGLAARKRMETVFSNRRMANDYFELYRTAADTR